MLRHRNSATPIILFKIIIIKLNYFRISKNEEKEKKNKYKALLANKNAIKGNVVVDPSGRVV